MAHYYTSQFIYLSRSSKCYELTVTSTHMKVYGNRGTVRLNGKTIAVEYMALDSWQEVNNRKPRSK